VCPHFFKQHDTDTLSADVSGNCGKFISNLLFQFIKYYLNTLIARIPLRSIPTKMKHMEVILLALDAHSMN